MVAPHAILIAGPTASGKSALALRLAEEVGGIIINADSMQVYRELRVLTARPTVVDEARAPHALYGCVGAAEGYSAGRYAADAARAIAHARRLERVPIIVGGTGLYFRALLEGLSPIPAIDPAVRAHWRGEAASRPASELHGLLLARDPATAARLMPTDRQRIVRALEVLEGTGQSLTYWQRTAGKPVLEERDTVRLLVLPDRATHGTAIAARFEAMLSAGALDEVRSVVRLALPPDAPIMGALGVAQLAGHLAGSMSLQDASSAATAATRQYAKRQLTWFRRNMITWKMMKLEERECFSISDLLFM